MQCLSQMLQTSSKGKGENMSRHQASSSAGSSSNDAGKAKGKCGAARRAGPYDSDACKQLRGLCLKRSLLVLLKRSSSIIAGVVEAIIPGFFSCLKAS
jgi:hypothetical protein